MTLLDSDFTGIVCRVPLQTEASTEAYIFCSLSAIMILQFLKANRIMIL